MKKNRTTKKILTILTLLACISIIVMPAGSVPITGKTGNTINVFLMNQDPDPADTGKLDLRWQVVVNKVGTIDNLEFYLDADYPLLFEAGDTPRKSLGTVVATGEVENYYVLHYKLKVADNALKGEYNVSLRWNDGAGGRSKKYFKINIDPSRPDFVIGALRTSPERLLQDTDEALLKIDIANIGTGNAENVKATLNLPTGFNASYAYSTEDALGTIKEDESETAQFYIDTAKGLPSGEYNTTLTLTYKEENDDDNTYKTKTLPLFIPIKSSPYLTVESVTTTPTIVTPDTQVKLLIKVKNTGSEEADAVSLRVFKDSTQPFDYDEKSDFIGKLKPGETGEALISLKTSKDAPEKKYHIDVELRGVETNKDNVMIFTDTAPLTIHPAEKSPLTPIVTILILVIIAGAGTYAYKKKK